MGTRSDETSGGVTRRHVIAGAGAAAAGAVLAGLAAPASSGAAAPDVAPQAFDPPIDGLSYLMIDPATFTPTVTSNIMTIDDSQGAFVAPAPPSKNVAAPLNLLKGSVIRQINVTYRGTPMFHLKRRPVDGTAPTALLTQALPAGSGAQTRSIALVEPVDGAATYALWFALPTDTNGVVAVSVGYVPPPSAFVPFAGADPRALDTRSGAKYQPDEEHVLDLSTFGAIGRAVVFNLTSDQPGGTGYLSAYSADLAAWPGNSNLNYSPATPNIANGVICTLGAGGKIKLRAGVAPTHVIVDVIGYLF